MSRIKIRELRRQAESHRRWANLGALSIEYAGWMAAADACEAQASKMEAEDAQHFARFLEAIKNLSGFKCAGCGSVEICESDFGDYVCAGCGHGYRSVTCQPQSQYRCEYCREVADTSSIFTGPVCRNPRCSRYNHWC